MGKIRNKKKSKQNIASNPLQSVNISLPANMSAEEMQHLIANAIIEAEDIKAQKEEEKRKAALAEWHNIVGYKEYQNKIKQFFNDVKAFTKILFLPKKYIEGDRASVAFLQEIMTFFFGILQALALVLCICFIFAIFSPGSFHIASLEIYAIIALALFAFVSFLLSCIFRIIRLEIDKVKDRNYLLGLFASITSLVSIIIAVIAIVKEA